MSIKLRILFVGESWLGSCARSIREALSRQPDVRVDDLSEDLYPPSYRRRWLRGVNRLLAVGYRRELTDAVLDRITLNKPDFVITYKGARVTPELVESLQEFGVKSVNIYPDISPHAYGIRHRELIGKYTGVISTKSFHPELWQTTYGYTNRCAFVPQGYDPLLHLQSGPVSNPEYDVALVATWRIEYHELLLRFADAIMNRGVKVAIAGNGWRERRAEFPLGWDFGPPIQGQAYVDWLRNARICIAPITTRVSIDGVVQPGDVDTTRTYELAAANCFFIHRRSRYLEGIYDEEAEVPFYDTPEELAEKVLFYLANPDVRERMAAAAHRRAVPAYSNDARAQAIVEVLRCWS